MTVKNTIILAVDSEEFEVVVEKKEFPEINQCEVIPDQPEEACFWEGNPICEWKCFDAEKGTDLNVTPISIVGGIVIVGLSGLYYIAKNSKKRSKK